MLTGIDCRHEDMKDLQCMAFTSKGASEIIVAGWQDTMLIIDVLKGEIVKQVGALVAGFVAPLSLTPGPRSLPNITTPL